LPPSPPLLFESPPLTFGPPVMHVPKTSSLSSPSFSHGPLSLHSSLRGNLFLSLLPSPPFFRIAGARVFPPYSPSFFYSGHPPRTSGHPPLLSDLPTSLEAIEGESVRAGSYLSFYIPLPLDVLGGRFCLPSPCLITPLCRGTIPHLSRFYVRGSRSFGPSFEVFPPLTSQTTNAVFFYNVLFSPQESQVSFPPGFTKPHVSFSTSRLVRERGAVDWSPFSVLYFRLLSSFFSGFPPTSILSLSGPNSFVGALRTH